MRSLGKPNPTLVGVACALFNVAMVVTAVAGTVLNTNDSGPGSLRDVIAAAPFGDTITFDPTLSGQTITLTNGQIRITNNLTVDASASAGIVISGHNVSRVFQVVSNQVVTLNALKVMQGRGGNGGGIYNSGDLTLTNCSLGGNYATSCGGGVYNDSGTLTVTFSTISTNYASQFGAGIFNGGGDIAINYSTVTSNTIGEFAGAGIYVTNGTASLNQSSLFGNRARFGGGIAVHYSGILAVTNCAIYQNLTGTGGCIDSFGVVTLSGSSVVSNAGAAILNTGTAVIDRSALVGNTRGGIINYGTAILNGSTVSSNSANTGGGIYILQGLVILADSTISRNSAGSGGGIFNGADGSLSVSHSTISSNSAVSDGGGIFNATGALTLENSIVAGNTAPTNSNVRGSITMWLGNNLTNGVPLLAPLGDYGGPTQTMPPLPGSPVIEAAALTTNTPSTDQRGAPRPNGPLPDLGAVEAFAFSTIPRVDSDADGFDDRLEPAYGFIVGNNDSAADSDGDGSPDATELFNMTDPSDPADNFRILSFSPTANFDPGTNAVFDLIFKTFPGLGYELETASTLPGFQPMAGSQITASNYAITLKVPLAPGQAFIRPKRN